MSLRVFAPAKLNLTLEVGPPNPDGRHPLRSLVAFADIGDRLEVSPADELTLQVEGPFSSALPSEPDNLVLRAARALRDEIGNQRLGAALRLEKNLPVASGIGGGSADAAAALRALAQVWLVALAPDALERIAGRLGADVPACLWARAGLMSGTGEDFAPTQLPRLDCVLANDLTPLSTAQVYAAFDDANPEPWPIVPKPAPSLRTGEEIVRLARERGNDLEKAALALAPHIAHVRDALAAGEHVRHVALSGSGATWFALMHNRADTEALASRLALAHPDWWVRASVLGG